MDCFAVAIGAGFANKNIKLKKYLLVALIFGIAHFIMPLIGWLIGDSFKIYIESIDHWVAFSLLLFIGSKMLYESFKNNNNKSFSMDKISVVLLLTLATSIDALIIGMSLAFLGFHLILSAGVISFFAFLISFIGFIVGKRFGIYFGKKAEIIGGIILIIIGFKILFDHLLNNI